MDFVKKAVSSASGGEKKDENKTENSQQGQEGQKGQEGQDYVDKAFGMAAKKSGHNISPEAQEKITDAGRSFYEKGTGKKVDPKISN